MLDPIRTGFMYMSLAGLSAIGLVLLAYWWTHSLVRVIENLRRNLGREGLAIFATVAVICTILAQKPTTNEPPDNVYSSFVGRARMLSLDLVSEVLDDTSDPTNDLRVTNFYHSNGLVQLSLESFPTNHALPVIDIYANYTLTNSAWAWVDSFAVSSASTNASLNIYWPEVFSNQVAIGLFPPNASLDAAFFIPSWSKDSDGDGMPDMWEIANGYDPVVAGEGLDSDNDGLLDQEEIIVGTNSNNSDTDGDGVDDGDEYYGGTNPLCSDTDGDGIFDGDERAWGTDPNEYETYEIQNDDDESTNGLFMAVLNSGDDLLLFPSEQETTAADGPDYEMVGEYDVNIAYQYPYSGDFSILGVYPPAGTTTLAGNTTGTWYDVGGPGYWNAFNLVATGAKFKPLKTGRFSFQANADDNVLLQIGTGDHTICATATYEGNNPGNLAQGLLIAGREYPIRVESSSIGGPAELSFPIWGRFESILKPQLVAQFSKSAIIFEDAYRNLPNRRMTPRRSTKSVLSIGVRGGDLGGTLQISTSNADCLSYLQGDDCLTGSYVIDAGETRYWRGTYRGIRASSAQGDVQVTVTFTENETGAVTTYTTSLTVVRIELTPRDVAPLEADRHRHIYGVGEIIYYKCTPEGVQKTVGSSFDDVMFYDGNFICPTAFSDNLKMLARSVTVEVFDAKFNSYFNVYRPRVSAKNPRVNIDGEGLFKIGEAGCLMLYLDMYASPLLVSFKGMHIREIVDDSQSGFHTGYYDDILRGGSWSHTKCNGAGVWNEVGVDGKYAIDKAGTATEYERPWMPGYKEWNIPMDYGWSRTSSGEILPCPPTKQCFTLDSNGSFSIQKFNYKAKRCRWGLTTINGKVAW